MELAPDGRPANQPLRQVNGSTDDGIHYRGNDSTIRLNVAGFGCQFDPCSEVSMAWGGTIFRAPEGVSVHDLPKDFQMTPLGTTDAIDEVLRRLFPDSYRTRGQCCLEGDEFWLELNYRDSKDKEPHDSIGVWCNAGQGVIPILRQVCDAFGARLFDHQTGDISDLCIETESSMTEFADWRDRVLGRDAPPRSDE